MGNQTGCGTVRSGSQGDCVAFLQSALNIIMSTKLVEDGQFGPLTQNAVAVYQRAKGLTVDAIVGDNTWNAIYNDLAKGTKVTPGATTVPKATTVLPGTTPSVPAPMGGVNWTTVGIVVALSIFAFMMFQKEFPDERD
ncbi:MAG: peptidoglycan-binding domain-containing protein [Candidatus Woesearchaeota archaeon]